MHRYWFKIYRIDSCSEGFHRKSKARFNKSCKRTKTHKRLKDSLQAIEHRKQHIAEIDKLLKECEISRFEDIASFNNNRERIASAIYSEKDEKQKSQWTSALKAVQIRNFPKARRFYIQKMKNEMWINDVKVYGSGASITFVSYIFSTNSNIQSGYQSVRPSLEELRFKRVNFKWAEYNEYTYYTIDSPSDGVI